MDQRGVLFSIAEVRNLFFLWRHGAAYTIQSNTCFKLNWNIVLNSDTRIVVLEGYILFFILASAGTDDGSAHAGDEALLAKTYLAYIFLHKQNNDKLNYEWIW